MFFLLAFPRETYSYVLLWIYIGKWNAHTSQWLLDLSQDIKKRWKEYTEELYKKDLHDPESHLEPDILECEIRWALESITRNKASESDGIPVELFQILKDDAVKVLHSICQQIWKTQQWPQDWKGQFSFHSQRMLKLLHNCTHLTC